MAFLTGPEARYINGTDLLVDGGQAAWMLRHMRRPGQRLPGRRPGRLPPVYAGGCGRVLVTVPR
ncbi:hypothetical protein [Streptomyces caelestis]